jgi:hypothetical protein
VTVCLPEERKALAERYTIDADEAQRREQLAIEEATWRAAEQKASQRAIKEDATEPPVDEQAPTENGELPIYRWFAET